MNNTFFENDFMAGWQGRPRAHRGDMAPIILRILREKPMHGYEIIRTLEEHSHGIWRPSAGSVYPTLQLLEEQELVVSREENGKKVYTLTAKGQTEAETFTTTHPWERKQRAAVNFRDISQTFRAIMHSLKDIAFEGTDQQVAEAKSILKDTGERLAAISTKNNE